ncbi:fumarylacetoacetate hydrolase family protein [Paenibacillus soyae]|uniref:Fumarylacetoacetate hydrolase family protein n=1 Tax=Paenibacillus soyae TaxID=2969249 RepID=A0A9X2MRV4_9BACL|nr:fumarylacetoacetate hydrolase family protein [Paenibacillus soyae]MCR2805689.1 fumarylacetoacetate hydrolase family protein [Paenibacillus soyae]
MKFVTVAIDGRETLGVIAPHGIVLVETINRVFGTRWSTELFQLLQDGEWETFRNWFHQTAASSIVELEAQAEEALKLAPLYRHPRKIWGVGFNYAADEEALAAADRSEEPVGFMKPDTSLIGYGESIVIPPQSGRVIAEAELAIVIGRVCRDVEESDVASYIAGYATVLDIGADDIHGRNPRFLTRSKSFDTFFSFGPELLTPDEVVDVSKLVVSTVLNGERVSAKQVALMRYRPEWIVSFHSKCMTLVPGDILMTGTPGAAVVRPGDQVECRIDGFRPLRNPVRGGSELPAMQGE